MAKMYDYGLALSGGGARGFAHLGVAQALDEAGIRPGIYAGTSAGAIAAAFLADGYAPGEVLDIFLQQKIYRIVGLSIPRLGLGNIQGMERVLRKHLKAKRIEDLKTPLIIAATDLNAGQVRYFDEGELIPRIIASASIPILFQPVKIDDRLYIDGGITDMLPVAPLEDSSR
ncbi:MAG: patatin-like phospholipase family protein, partial [Bacteroidales bacterium]|nr:patatin-like phospholipase family protein [Bacteroidales bacterium]